MRRILDTASVIGISIIVLLLCGSPVAAATLQLSWVDNSSDETGFGIERKVGTTGTYGQIATVAATVTTYTDMNLTDAATYCYRVFAFNSVGISPYSPEACGTAKAPVVQTFTLSVAAAGTGSGTITSSPAGISCGGTCSSSFNSGTSVALTATPASGSVFAGWSGTGCGSGSVTMNSAVSCTATFNLQSPQTFTLTVSKTGSGTGTVTSSHAGINCGTTCSSTFGSGTALSLVATPGSGSTFAGWSGDADCSDGSVTMNANKSCTATFNSIPTTYTLTVSVIGSVTSGGTGQGSVVSAPIGINCGATCSASFQSGAAVTLQAVPASGSVFAGWSGDADCSDGSVTMNGAKTCAATFQTNGYSLTVSRSGTGTGKITANVSAIDCGTNCFVQFSKSTTVKLKATPGADSVFSGWSGDNDCLNGYVTVNGSRSCIANFSKRPVAKVGLFRPSSGAWYLVNNDTGAWRGCDVDLCLGPFGQTGDLAINGDWTGSGNTTIGVYDPAQSSWKLDNGDGMWDGCGTDRCLSFTVPDAMSGALPVTGTWNGLTRDSVGIYQFLPSAEGKRSATGAGYWYLDGNGNGKWDGCRRDKCLGPFGGPGDVPVVGDWNGNQVDKIGTFDPATGQWQLDLNGNGKWDGCKVDKCLGPFGITGDVPVAGDWNGTGISNIGVFRPTTGEWFLDLNGNGQWDGPDVDKYIAGFGQAGDLPVVGKR